MSKPYTCLNFIPMAAYPTVCRVCGQGRSKHVDFDQDWKPPPIDDEYREKRSIELNQFKGEENEGD